MTRKIKIEPSVPPPTPPTSSSKRNEMLNLFNVSTNTNIHKNNSTKKVGGVVLRLFDEYGG